MLLGDLIKDEKFTSNEGKLTLALGKNIGGVRDCFQKTDFFQKISHYLKKKKGWRVDFRKLTVSFYFVKKRKVCT